MTKKVLLAILMYIVSSTSAVLVNKYVLTNLKFTYPTVYQSWQMFVAAFLLLLSYTFGYIEVDLQASTFGTVIKSWVPAMFSFTLSIYSGSIALATLPIPIFCLIQQSCTQLFVMMSRLSFGSLSNYEIMTMIGSVGSMVFVVNADKGHSVNKYKWIFIHCLSAGFYSFYAVHINDTQLKEIDKMILNSISSVLLLMTFGYLTGEIDSVFTFPFFYQKHFHLGCILSGIFGTMVMLSYSNLCSTISLQKVRFYNSCTMLLVSGISAFVFSVTFTGTVTFVVLFGFANIIIYAYLVSYRNKPMETEKSPGKIVSM